MSGVTTVAIRRKTSPTQPLSTDRQPTSVVIGELESLTTQLASKDPNFPSETRPLGAPGDLTSGEDGQHHLQSGRLDHGRSLYHDLKTCRIVDPAMGQYGH